MSVALYWFVCQGCGHDFQTSNQHATSCGTCTQRPPTNAKPKS